METAGYVQLGVGLGLILVIWPIILLIRRFFLRMPNWWAPEPWVLWPPTLGYILLIFGTGLLAGQSRWWLFFLIPLQLFFLAVFIFGLFRTTGRDGTPAWLAGFWNMDKALGGSVFGDFANTVGVLAGVGAYQLSNQSEGWFWIGQFGGFLAILVGISLAIRASQSGEGTITGEPAWEGAMAVGNLSVGIFTFLALITPKNAASVPAGEVGFRWFLIVWLIGLIFFIILAIAAALTWAGVIDSIKYPAHKHRQNFVRFVLWVFRLLIPAVTLMAFVFTIISVRGTFYASRFAYAFGFIAVLSWVAIEIANIVKVWSDHTQIASLFRSLMIIFGSAALLFVVSYGALQDNAVFEPIHWILYGNALTLAGLATLMGIHLGFIKLSDRYHARQAAQRRVLANVNNAFRVPRGVDIEQDFNDTVVVVNPAFRGNQDPL